MYISCLCQVGLSALRGAEVVQVLGRRVYMYIYMYKYLSIYIFRYINCNIYLYILPLSGGPKCLAWR